VNLLTGAKHPKLYTINTTRINSSKSVIYGNGNEKREEEKPETKRKWKNMKQKLTNLAISV